MEPTVSSPTQRQDLSESMTRANNMEFNFNGQHYLMNRKPDYFVYLHSVSEQSFEVSRPPLIRKMTLVGKAHGQKSTKCASFPQPLLTPLGNVDSNELSIIPMDARRFCMDIVNPDNLGLDQNAVIKGVTSIGNDLGKKGVFWSLNEEPTDEEIKQAVKRMETYYKELVEKANTVQASSPKDLPDTLTPEHHAAADYLADHFGMTFQWHAKMSRLEECELCGERIKAGIAFHRLEDGGICVRSWERAVKAGARTRQQAYDATGDEKWLPKQPSAPVEKK